MAVNWAKSESYADAGYGYEPCAISTMERPRDHTSDEAVYVALDSAVNRSGCDCVIEMSHHKEKSVFNFCGVVFFMRDV